MADSEQPGQPIPRPVDEQLYGQPQFGLPDPQSLELTKYLTEDRPFLYGSDDPDDIIEGDIPPDMLRKFWGFLSKDIVLSMFTEKDVDLAMLRFKKTKLAYIMSMPRSDFSYTTIRHLNNLENKVKARLNRALNGFERKQQTTQTQATIYGTMSDQDDQRKRSHGPLGLGRIFGGGGG